MLLLKDSFLIEGPFILINEGDLVLRWKCSVKPSYSFGIWVFYPLHDGVVNAQSCGRLLIVLFPFPCTQEQVRTRRLLGWVFLRSVFRYLFLVCEEMETKGPYSKKELCCLYAWSQWDKDSSSFSHQTLT